MRAFARSAVVALAALSACGALPAVALAQAPPAARKAAAPPASAAKPNPVLSQPLATVNDEVVTRGEIEKFLSQYQVTRDIQEQAYRDAMDTLINTHLINQFLARQRIPVKEEKVTEAIATLEKQLKLDGSDLATELLRSNTSMADVRKEYANRIRWVDYMDAKATDAELRKFAAGHKDLFSGTQVKASHILLRVDPKASAADKEKARQKLLGIKQDVAAKKMTFAEAANKFSEDPANAEGHGGDVGYFSLNSGFIEEFATAAFALPKGAVSDVVETPYGLHLITVTDRKEGTPLDFEQNKPFVKSMYGADLQKNLLTAVRKTAKIDIKPMPADLFPPEPAAAADPAAPKAAAPKAAAPAAPK